MKTLVQVPLALGLSALGAAAAVALVFAGRQAEADAPPAPAPTVEVYRVTADEVPVVVEATGSVAADQQVSLSAQVSGAVAWVSPKLIPGGRFERGEPLLRVDDRDFSLAVQQAEAQVRQAELELALEEGRGEVARREWALLDKPGEPPPLALRAPHLAAARAALASAEASLGLARLNLERTSLRAPFNALVVSENVDPGQVLSPGFTAVGLVGSDRLRVTVSVPVAALTVLDVPGVNAERGAAARVTQALSGGREVVREGELLALSGQLDAQTRTAQLVVAVDAPLEADVGGLPLLPGAFVDVDLQGRPVAGAVRVPREAVLDGDRVWVVEEGRLRSRRLELAWEGADAVWARSGLAPGDEVVLTRLGLPIEGMDVRVVEGGGR